MYDEVELNTYEVACLDRLDAIAAAAPIEGTSFRIGPCAWSPAHRTGVLADCCLADIGRTTLDCSKGRVGPVRFDARMRSGNVHSMRAAP